ncbi:MAG: motility associated factor glycosyltransferase family protein, partial [bacterium]|nr:motility associated factor glycosyltransferase family protein [bacterium]
IVILGLGLGYHLQAIFEKKDPLARVLLVEPEIEILHHSLKVLDWARLLKRKDFFYVFGSDLNVIMETVHDFINIGAFDRLEFIELSSETRLLRSFFTKARETLDSEIKANIYDFKTRLAESYMVPRNILQNLPGVLNSRPITHLQNRFAGTPGIIVSAGPSLDRNILSLKKINNRALMVAVDTALKPLLSRSIQPHFTAIGDPSHKNYLHLQGTEKQLEHFIVAEAGISNQVYRDFPGNIFSLSIGKAIVRMLENNSEPLGEIHAWGSVISIALDFAVYMGLNPIIFVGQDFAFSNTRNHCRGTSWEEKKIEYSRNLDELQRFEAQSIAGNRKVIEVDDIYGHKTYTSERLTLYKNFLARLVSKYPHVQFINATEGGIFSEIPRMNLQDAIQRFVFGREPVDVQKLHRLPTLNKKENIQRLIEFLNQKAEFFRDYLEQLVQTLKLMEKAGTMEFNLLTLLIQQSEQLQNNVYILEENGEMLEMWSAAPMYHFLKEYKHIRNRPLNESTVRKGLELFKKYFRGIKPLVKDIVKQLEKTSKTLNAR